MKKMQYLLILFLALFVQSLGSPLDERDMELLDMVFRDGDDSDISRSQREVAQTATSEAWDENSSEADYPLFNEAESEEDCLDILSPIEHPCFMRLILLRTPLLKHDPCANFSLAVGTSKRTKLRKCVKKTKTTSTTEPITTTSAETEALFNTPPIVLKNLGIVPNTKEVNNTTETTTISSKENSTTTNESTTFNNFTTTDDSTTSIEEDFTTTTDSPTTLPSTTTTSTSTTRSPNQLKSFSIRKRHRKSKKPRVPDPPKIKIDGAILPSEVIQVIYTTEVGELRRQLNDTTTIRPETTTEMMEETTNEVETTTQEMEFHVEAMPAKTTTTEDPLSKTEELCDDTDELDTNLCPQFMSAPEENAPHQRHRKPIKNYVEPILYEGHFAKPRQRIGTMTQTVPRQKDYFFTNKQIMPKPKPKYRKRLPHSFYMNNIVRGLKCVDLPPGFQNRISPRLHPAQQFWGLKRKTSRTFAPTPTYHHQQRYEVKGTPSPPSSQTPDPFSVPVPLYFQHNDSDEDFPQDKHRTEQEYSYFDSDKSDLWHKYRSSNTNVDPCQLEHEHLERRHQNQDEKEEVQLENFGQQQMAANFFT